MTSSPARDRDSVPSTHAGTAFGWMLDALPRHDHHPRTAFAGGAPPTPPEP